MMQTIQLPCLQSSSAVLRVEYESQVAAHAETCVRLQEALTAHSAQAAESAHLLQLVGQLRATEAQLKVRQDKCKMTGRWFTPAHL
jgi:hypothetical protein